MLQVDHFFYKSQYFNKKPSKKCILSYVFLFFFLKQRIEKNKFRGSSTQSPFYRFSSLLYNRVVYKGGGVKNPAFKGDVERVFL